MNEAMPQWRTFDSGQPQSPPPIPQPPTREPSSARAVSGPVLVILVALGGAAAGAALIALGFVILMSLAPVGDGSGAVPDPLEARIGEPLDAADPATAAILGSGGASGQAGGEIVVDVAGAVVRPGLQRLPSGARIGEAIEAAGGFAPRVDLAEAARSLNLAQPLGDGDKVLVPELGIGRPQAPDDVSDGRIDLNRADQALLETLPGIGPVTAGKIIAARASAPFSSVQDLRDRGIVGESVFGQIRELVSAG